MACGYYLKAPFQVLQMMLVQEIPPVDTDHNGLELLWEFFEQLRVDLEIKSGLDMVSGMTGKDNGSFSRCG